MHKGRLIQWIGGIAAVLAAAGCGQVGDRHDSESNRRQTAETQGEQGMHQSHQPHKYGHGHGHGHSHGAFADAEKVAARLNSPERDAWQKPEEIVAALGLHGGMTVADVGAGTGYMVAHLSQAVGDTGTVIAVDAEQAMVDYLMKHAKTLGPATVQPRKAEIDTPALDDESVHAMLILDTWHHIDRRTDYASKVYNALKPGGRLVIVDYELAAEVGPPQEMRVSPEQVTKELTAAGFRTQVADEHMPRHYLIVAHKD